MPTAIRAPAEAELLTLWERGRVCHPIDRSLLLCAWTRPDLPTGEIADLPLGTINNALLHLRKVCFGNRIDTYADCERCGQRLEVALDAGQLMASMGKVGAPREFSLRGFRFRMPASRDLAAIAGDRDPDAAALKLLERCCVERPETSMAELAELLAEVEARLEELDPAADLNLDVACASCGHRWMPSLDLGALLWDEIDAYAQRLFAEVHHLARTYGWTEPEILALSPGRRATYLEMVGA
jgi:hypothetical protein